MTEDYFVYSTDPDENREIQRRAAAQKSKPADAPVDPAAVVVRLSIERKGRGGKVVTIAGGFPANEAFLKSLTKRLKKACGTGGTFRIIDEHERSEGVVEIQGDRREDVRALLARDGFRTQGDGAS